MNIRRTIGALFLTAGLGTAAYNIEQGWIEGKPNNVPMNLLSVGLSLTGASLCPRRNNQQEDAAPEVHLNH